MLNISFSYQLTNYFEGWNVGFLPKRHWKRGVSGLLRTINQGEKGYLGGF